MMFVHSRYKLCQYNTEGTLVTSTKHTMTKINMTGNYAVCTSYLINATFDFDLQHKDADKRVQDIRAQGQKAVSVKGHKGTET